jgi:hypothetical protein
MSHDQSFKNLVLDFVDISSDLDDTERALTPESLEDVIY